MVDGGFAADRRIDLRQQRGGHLHKRHAAHIAGGGKAGHVANHPAAQRKQHRFAIAPVAQQGVKNQVEGLPVFVLFAIGQHHGVNKGIFRRQRAAQSLGVQRCHGGVGDDQRRRRFGQRGVGGRVAQQAGANHDGVTALAQVNGDGVGSRRISRHRQEK